MDQDDSERPRSLIEANEGDRCKFSELSLTLLLKNKLILIDTTRNQITLNHNFQLIYVYSNTLHMVMECNTLSSSEAHNFQGDNTTETD